MAFVQVETWKAAPVLPATSPPIRSLSPLLEKALKNGRDLYLRRTVAIGISILVHIGLIWFLLNRIGGAADILQSSGAKALTIVDLLESPASEASASAPKALPKPPAAAVSTELDVSAAALPPAPEWSVSRIRVALPSEPASFASDAPVARAPGMGRGAGSGGYDPYAGASPMRRDVETVPGAKTTISPAQDSNRDVKLDKIALERVVRAIRARTGLRGEFHLLTKVAATGLVVEVDTADPVSNPSFMAVLRDAMLGQRLFVVNGDIGSVVIRLSIRV